MRALCFEQFQQPPKLMTLPDPVPSDEVVVVQVEATGLCRSDWHGWMGHDEGITLPHVPGHEFAGRIVATGRHIKKWQVGDRVTVPFVSGCGTCPECHAGHQQVCEAQFQPGFTHWGSFAEYVALDFAEHNLVKLPDNLSFETAASLGCRFATAFRGVVDQGQVRAGQWVAVHGCGGVGLSAIMIASALGAQVVAIDISDDALALAKQVGAHAIILAKDDVDVAQAVADITSGGAHLSIDALGHPTTCFNSVNSLRRRGKHVQIGLLLGGDEACPLPMAKVIGWELEIYGSHGMQAHRYDAMLAMIESGVLAPQKLINQEISLADAVHALPHMDEFKTPGATIITSFREE